MNDKLVKVVIAAMLVVFLIGCALMGVAGIYAIWWLASRMF